MIEWLLAPIDSGRAHDVGFAVSWHARSMTLAWAVLAPVAILSARFLKILPWQDWPRELDSALWWRLHWMTNSAVFLLTGVGLWLILLHSGKLGLHGALGYAVTAGLVLQITLGIFRGTKGGPTAPAKDGSLHGDHYDMTPWRRMFEQLHKSLGYALLFLAAVTLVLGLWQANAPRWMWTAIGSWWLMLCVLSVYLHRNGWAFDTYQAIWGPGPEHPGNRMPGQGWGMRRLETEDKDHVRRD